MLAKQTKCLKAQLNKITILGGIILFAIVDDVEKRFDQDDAGRFPGKDIAELDVVAKNVSEVHVK